MIDLMPYVMTVIVSVVTSYIAMTVRNDRKIAVLEQELHQVQSDAHRMEKRIDSHSEKIDEILKGISDIKISVTKIETVLNITGKEAL